MSHVEDPSAEPQAPAGPSDEELQAGLGAMAVDLMGITDRVATDDAPEPADVTPEPEPEPDPEPTEPDPDPEPEPEPAPKKETRGEKRIRELASKLKETEAALQQKDADYTKQMVWLASPGGKQWLQTQDGLQWQAMNGIVPDLTGTHTSPNGTAEVEDDDLTTEVAKKVLDRLNPVLQAQLQGINTRQQQATTENRIERELDLLAEEYSDFNRESDSDTVRQYMLRNPDLQDRHKAYRAAFDDRAGARTAVSHKKKDPARNAAGRGKPATNLDKPPADPAKELRERAVKGDKNALHAILGAQALAVSRKRRR